MSIFEKKKPGVVDLIQTFARLFISENTPAGGGRQRPGSALFAQQNARRPSRLIRDPIT